MGSSATKEGKEPAVADPLSGLTPKQIRAVQTTWARVQADQLGNGLELFKRLFKTDPETKDFFSNFRTMSEQELIDNAQFQAHVVSFMTAVDVAVANLRRPAMVGAMMDKLGQTHTRRNVKRKHFNSAKGVLVGMLQNDLQLNEYQMAAWSAFVEFMYQHIFSQLKAEMY